MYSVTKKEWAELKRNHPDYVGRCLTTHEHEGKVCKRGEGMCFESVLSGNPAHGTTLIFEHIHFEIV